MIEITMPRLSDTMEEGAIATWHKHPGDRVEVGDVLVEIETDKATMEYEAYEAGTLSQILVDEGATVAIGEPIALLDDGRAPAPTPASGPAADSAPVAPATSLPSSEVAAVAPDEGERRIASPLVRRLAREHGLDLGAVRGSGPGGRIIRADIDALLAAPSPSPAPLLPAPAPTPTAPAPTAPTIMETSDEKRASEAISLSRARRTIARRLGESARTIPHFYVTVAADAELLVTMRTDLNERLAERGEPRISLNDLLVRASALALREHPLVNASYVDDANATMLVHHRINVGVAVASPNGLVVPVITDADQKTASQIGAETRALATQAGTKGLSIDQMSGGTFTISNLGMYGVEEFTAIINPPESAILAVGATTREPVVVGDAVVARHRIRFTLSADHRIIDGALAADFLKTLVAFVESPWRIIA